MEFKTKILTAKVQLQSYRYLFYLSLDVEEGTNCDPIMCIFSYLLLMKESPEMVIEASV